MTVKLNGKLYGICSIEVIKSNNKINPKRFKDDSLEFRVIHQEIRSQETRVITCLSTMISMTNNLIQWGQMEIM